MPGLTLFVIIDPTKEHQHALAHAAEIANIAGGHIHAFCAVYEDDLSGYTSRRDAKYKIKHLALDKIDDMINPLVNDGVTVSREVIWNDHWYQAAVHACARVGADYMVKCTDTRKDRPGFFKLLSFRSDADDEKPPGELLISSHFGIEPDKIHLASGPAKQAIVESAMQIDAQLLVLGTIARAGGSGAVLGNNCEKVS